MATLPSSFFFVLSGYVLGLGLHRQGRGTVHDYGVYAVRRVFRVYPVLVFSTLAILAFLILARCFGGGNFWFNHVLAYHQTVLNSDSFPSGRVIADNLLLLGASLNLVTWTLGVEMVSSLLLPLAHYARMRLPASGTWMLLAASGFLALLGKWFLLLGWVRFEGAFPWEVFSFFYLFYLGYLLPVLGPRWLTRIKSSRSASGFLLAGALCLWLVANRFGQRFPLGATLGAGLGAWIVLGVLSYGFNLRAFRCLDWPVVRFFGRISYSFYLLHDLVLITCSRLGAHFVFHDHAPAYPFTVNLALGILSVLIATPVAWAAHRWIETPFIQMGRHLVGGFRRPSKLSEPDLYVRSSGGPRVEHTPA